MALSPEQTERYHRSLLLPEIGVKGQERLTKARVLVVGAGGLGSAAALYLAAAGVGRLGIVDGDCVELSNLQRQVLYRTSDAGRKKARLAARTLRALNRDIEVIPLPVTLAPDNAEELVRDYDVVVDAVDNTQTRCLVNDTCLRTSRPWIEAGVTGTTGFVTTFLPDRGPCYRCLFPDPPGETEPGILSTVPGVVGVLQANEALKVLLGTDATLAGRLLAVDLWTNEFRLVAIAEAPDCPSHARPS